MLYIVFTEMEHELIKVFKNIPLAEANYLTEKIEQEYRQENKKAIGEFYVINLDEKGEPELLYRGSFKFGYYESPNIYQHIKKTVPSIKVRKEKEREKVSFLENLDRETESRYKVIENIDSDLAGIDKSRISKLTRNRRRMIYGVAIVSSLLLAFTLFTSFVKTSAYESALNEGRQIVDEQKEELSIYEKGLIGEQSIVSDYLNKKKDITDNQKLILANLLIKEKKFKEVVEMYGDVSFVANLVSNSNQATLQDSINLLKEFDNLYPTNQAKYDLAYWSGNYEFMLKIPEVQMNVRRSRMKTYAHLKMGQLEEAKAELANNNNERLKTQIGNYELLDAEIATLEEKIKTAKASYQNTKELEDELKEKQKELNSI